MKTITFTTATLLLLTLSLFSIPGAQAQDTAVQPASKQKLTPKATMKGVGTEKVVKGTKNALREIESTAGKDNRKVGKEVSKDTGKVKKSLSQDLRKIQKAVSGQDKKKAPVTTKP